MKYKSIVLMTALMMVAACQSSTPILALVVYRGAGHEDLQFLQESIGNMLNTNGVILSDSAFTVSSEIIIERRSRGRSLSVSTTIIGRDYGAPDHFRLWLQEGSCLLEHVETGNILLLKQLRCEAQGSI